MRQRVGIVGLVHDHVWGLLKQWDSLADVEIVAIAEPNERLFAKVALHRSTPRFYHSWEELLQKEPLDLVQITNENNAGASLSSKPRLPGRFRSCSRNLWPALSPTG